MGAPSNERPPTEPLIELTGACYCPKCGSPVKEDADFCPKCGNPIGPAGVAPKGSPPGSARKSRRKLWIGIGILIIVVIIALSVYAYESVPGNALNPYKVRVGQVIWTTNGNSLGSSAGFSVRVGLTPTVSITLSCPSGFFGPRTCTSGSVYVLTDGFGVASTNAPFTWSSGNSGATAAVSVKLTIPTSSYSGDLTIDLH